MRWLDAAQALGVAGAPALREWWNDGSKLNRDDPLHFRYVVFQKLLDAHLQSHLGMRE